MATYKRLPRGRKKPTNEFATFAEKTYAWILTNWRIVAFFSAAAVVIFGVIVGGYKYVDWRASRAADALAKAQRVEDSASRQKWLAEVAKEYPGTAAGREAMVFLSAVTLSEEQFDEAKVWLEMLEQRSRRYPILRVYALHNLGKLYEQQNEWEKAADAYGKAMTVKGNLIKNQSVYKRAFCLEKMGRFDEAGELYARLLDESANADLMTKARSEERLLWLKVHRQAAGD